MYKRANIFLVIIIAVAVGAGGYFIGLDKGLDKGEQKAESRLMSVIDMAYPSPPEVLHTAGGVIKGVYGATITLEIIDPEDYLPHADGSPHKKMTKFVTVGSETEILKIDYINPQADGSPTKTNLEISDLREGEQISIQTEDNLRTDKKVVAGEIKLIKY